MNTLAHELLRCVHRIHRSRSWAVTGAVLLAHAGLAWLLSQGLRISAPPMTEVESVILASVVTDATASGVVIAQPMVVKVQPRTSTEPLKPVTVKTQPAPTQAASISPANSNPATIAAATAAADQPRSNPGTSHAALALPSSDADYLNNPAPAYPRMSKRLGEQGTVVVRVFINAEGRAEQAEIRTGSGYPRLDESALDTVKRWRYVPGKRAGVAEAMWFNVPVRFVLD